MFLFFLLSLLLLRFVPDVGPPPLVLLAIVLAFCFPLAFACYLADFLLLYLEGLPVEFPFEVIDRLFWSPKSL